MSMDVRSSASVLQCCVRHCEASVDACFWIEAREPSAVTGNSCKHCSRTTVSTALRWNDRGAHCYCCLHLFTCSPFAAWLGPLESGVATA